MNDMTNKPSDAKLQARLWNVVPDLAYPDSRKAESIASADELTPTQRRAAYALLREAENA